MRFMRVLYPVTIGAVFAAGAISTSDAHALQGADACPGPACPGSSSSSYPSSPPPRPARPPSTNTQSGPSTVQAIGSMMNYLNQWQQLNDQIDASNRAAEQQRQAEQQRAMAAERADAIARERDRRTVAPTDTPRILWDQWEGEGKQDQSSASATKGQVGKNPWVASGDAPSAVKDPNTDHAGESCSYFTRPSTDGESFVRSYADGAFVIYGRFGYECVNRRWVNKGPARVWTNPEKYDAARLEGGE